MGLFDSPESLTSDPAANFTTRQSQLEARRKLAMQLVAQGMAGDGGQGYHGGRVYMVGNQLGNVAKSLGGAFMGNQADKAANALASEQAQAQADWSDRYNAAAPEAQQGLLIEARNKGLRYDLEQQFQKAEQDRIERGEQLAADRVAKADEAERARIERGEQLAADRVARQDLRATPTIHITTGGGGQSGNPAFAGAATQIGVDARDPSKAVYRIGKTGEVFSFDENGQPTAHEGAIAPKPAPDKASTEAERGAAGYLGRMEAAEENLTGAKPLNFAKQQGLNRAPGLTNFTLTDKEQVVRQQQEDWVRAKLRKESGAVIGDEEMAREIRTYFPQSGDSQAVLKQKAQSRAQALEQMRTGAGKVKPTIAAPVAPTKAPQAAIDYLKAHPEQANAFKSKYGYLP
jgi:hypothetical protein